MRQVLSRLLTLSGAKRARLDLPFFYPFNVEDGTKGLYEIRNKQRELSPFR